MQPEFTPKTIMPAPEFFNVQPVQAALENLFAHWNPIPTFETLDPRNALDRVLAKPTYSPINLPTFTRSTMDGYALRAADTFGASQSLPVYLTCIGAIPMGVQSDIHIGQGETVEIHTGGMLPSGADAVVMIERTQIVSDNEIEVLAPVANGENVIQIGEDVAEGDLILPAGHRIRPPDIGGLLSVGITSVEVAIKPKFGILSCGDELVLPEGNPTSGQIRDINAHTLAALIQQSGGDPILLGIARDTFEDYQRLAHHGFADVDILVMTAGSSVSTRDYTRDVINSLGQPGVLQHGLAVKPGKPTILAVCDGKPVIGLPGNPVSALLIARQILVPIIKHRLGELPQYPHTIKAKLTSNIPSSTGRDDTIPIKLIERDGELFAEPIFGKSNLIFTLVNADGLLHIPLNSNGIKAGTLVEIVRFND
jgi:molybdopterin molybdotransferase